MIPGEGGGKPGGPEEYGAEPSLSGRARDHRREEKRALAASWEEVYGQGPAVRLLRSFLERGEVPHAMLFLGPRGVGKSTVARLFAAAYLCPSGGLDDCPSCRRVMEGIHPDFHLVEPEGLQIRKEQVDELERSLHLKPAGGKGRVAVVEEAGTMNVYAANAFLKTLEEPPPGTCIILVAEREEELLPTLVSRCTAVRFHPIPTGEIERYLVEVEGLDGVEAGEISRWSGGVFGRAVSWARDRRRLRFREAGVDFAARARREGLADLLFRLGELREEWESYSRREAELPEAYRQAVDQWSLQALKKKTEERNKRETARRRREAVEDFLDGMASFYRDIIVYDLVEGGGADPVPRLVNRGRWQEVESEALILGRKRAGEKLALVEWARRALEGNVDPALTLDALAAGLKGWAGPSRR
jgi:DNA polymerase-3 subunit delta'